MTVVLRERPTFAPLGIRFWDPVLDQQVRGGLSVSARALGGERRTQAYRTASDLYVFGPLPGLREVEQAPDPLTPEGSPPRRRRFVIEVEDRLRRYLPVAFTVDLPLPYAGPFLNGISSPHQPAPPGFHLYAAPDRSVPTWLAAVRATLVDVASRGPAAHAVLCLHLGDGGRWDGIADAEGRVLVLLPVPTITGGGGASPMALADRRRLAEQSFPVEIEVRYDPAAQVPLPSSELPDLLGILRQPQGLFWPRAPEDGGTAISRWPDELPYRRELILHSAGRTTLLVGAAPASP